MKDRTVSNIFKLLILKTTREEMLAIGYLGICDHCNHAGREKGCYFAAFDLWVCEDCYDTFLNGSVKYMLPVKDNISELNNFNVVKAKLNRLNGKFDLVIK